MKRSVTVLLILLISITTAAGQTSAVIKNVSGKVEVQLPGGEWVSATEGAQVPGGAQISVGFNSQAVLELGATTVVVRPLTRMTVERIATEHGIQQTRLFMPVGRVRADVRTAEGLRHDFQIRTPVSTAAVRGTLFEAGVGTLTAIQGPVELRNRLGQGRLLVEGDQSRTEGGAPPKPPEENERRSATVTPYTSHGGHGAERRGRPTRTPVRIELIW